MILTDSPNVLPRSKRCVVVIDSEIWTDLDWSSLTMAAQWSWMHSLFRLAEMGEPHGVYPHTEHAAEMRRAGASADATADELLRVGLWEFVGLGYRVRPYCGWYVRRERRAYIGVTTRRAVYERDEGRCVTCGSVDDLTLDHITPWSRGGSDDLDNLQLMCLPCNMRKGARV